MRRSTLYAGLAVFLCTTIVVLGEFSVHAQNILPLTPAQQAREHEIGQLDEDALAAQKAGRYAEAVNDASQALELGQDSGLAQEILAYSLNAQGKS